MTDQIVARFSCGAASFVALTIAIERYGSRVEAVNAFLAAEHADNRRFLADVERYLGIAVTVLQDTKYDADPLKVWWKKRFIAGKDGAPCSKALKGEILDAYRPKAVMVLGYTADEADRLDRFLDANAGRNVIAPLIEDGITKDDCFQIIADAGLVLPVPYLQGFRNSNCLKCPKGGLGYWKHIDLHYPESYEQVARLQDVLGPKSWFLSDRKNLLVSTSSTGPSGMTSMPTNIFQRSSVGFQVPGFGQPSLARPPATNQSTAVETWGKNSSGSR